MSEKALDEMKVLGAHAAASVTIARTSVGHLSLHFIFAFVSPLRFPSFWDPPDVNGKMTTCPAPVRQRNDHPF